MQHKKQSHVQIYFFRRSPLHQFMSWEVQAEPVLLLRSFFFVLNDAKTDASCLEMTLELKKVILRNLLFSQSDARANV